MFVDLQNKYDWVLQPVVGYPSVDRLIEVLEDKVVRPAEAKFNELLTRRTNQLRVENVCESAERARLRWQRSLGAGGGNRPALPLARPLARSTD